MIYFIVGVIALYFGFKLGRKYQDLQDLMLARRVSKIIEQGKALSDEKEQYEKWKKQDERGKMLFTGEGVE